MDSGKFEDNPNLTVELTQVDGIIWRAEINKEGFLPGRYTVYYCGYNGNFKGSYVDLLNEITPSEIAERLAKIQIGETTLRLALDKMSRQVDEILKILKTKWNISMSSFIDGKRLIMNPPT